MARVLPQPLDELRLGLEDVDRRQARRRHGRRVGGREEERPRAVLEHRPQGLRSGDVATEHADRLRERADLDVHPAVEVEMVDAAPAVPPEHPGRVGVIDVDDRVVLLGQLDDLRQLGDVAVHAEHAIGDDEDGPVRIGFADLPQGLAQGVHIGVREDLAARLRQADAVDDARVIEGVGHDRGALGREDRDDAGVAGEARLEREDRLDVLEGRQARLELLVQPHRAGDRADRS